MIITAIPIFPFIYLIKNAGVGIGKIKYNIKMTNNATSNGGTDVMDGNFIAI